MLFPPLVHDRLLHDRQLGHCRIVAHQAAQPENVADLGERRGRDDLDRRSLELRTEFCLRCVIQDRFGFSFPAGAADQFKIGNR